jgi:hypothetical protein
MRGATLRDGQKELAHDEDRSAVLEMIGKYDFLSTVLHLETVFSLRFEVLKVLPTNTDVNVSSLIAASTVS